MALETGPEFLLGFDARISWPPEAARWNEPYRELYLLGKEAPDPLSIDTMVWPSVFQSSYGFFEKLTGTKLPLLAVEQEADPCPWINLTQMQEALKPLDYAPGYRQIAVSFFTAHPFQEPANIWPYYQEPVPAEIRPEWQLLGYDVADTAPFSGLTNCGYNEPASEVAELRARWEPELNDHHLFISLEAALEFRLVSNRRVPEHSPFFVYGLYLIG